MKKLYLFCVVLMFACENQNDIKNTMDMIDTQVIDTQVIDTQVIDTQVIDAQVIDAQVIDAQVIDTQVIDMSVSDMMIDLPDMADMQGMRWSMAPELANQPLNQMQSGISGIGGVEYLFYWPSNISVQSESKIPLLVALHGCDMNPQKMADVSRFNQMADLLGFAVLYPKQSSLNNITLCWNWFLAVNQGVSRHQAGEAYQIMQAVDKISMSYPIQKDDLWVAGISAGGAMTNILGVCYHSRVKKILSMAGVAFGIASNITEASAVMGGRGVFDAQEMARVGYACEMTTKHQMKAMVVQGKEDQTVSPVNAQKIVKQMIVFNDLLDDQVENQSVSENQLVMKRYEPMVYYPYEISSLGDQGPLSSVVLIEVDRLGHAWSGGKSGMAYSDPLGPGVSWWFVADF